MIASLFPDGNRKHVRSPHLLHRLHVAVARRNDAVVIRYDFFVQHSAGLRVCDCHLDGPIMLSVYRWQSRLLFEHAARGFAPNAVLWIKCAVLLNASLAPVNFAIWRRRMAREDHAPRRAAFALHEPSAAFAVQHRTLPFRQRASLRRAPD